MATDPEQRERESKDEPEDKFHLAGEEEQTERGKLAERIAAEPELEERDDS
jgi:hypothetical protein